jgi:hypothetical protein
MMSPAEVYVALEGETPPLINAIPAGNWVMLGTAGMRNQATAGVKIAHTSTLAKHSTAGATGNVKAFRTMEEVTVEVSIEDLTLEVYAKAMNLAGIREVVAASGVAGYKSFGGKQGFDVQTWSILVRVAASPYGDGMNMQWYFPKCIEEGQIELTFDGEGTAAGLNFKYSALCDPNAASDSERFFICTAQTAAALP